MGWHTPQKGHRLLLHQADSPGEDFQLSLANIPLLSALSCCSWRPYERLAKAQQVHGQGEPPSSYSTGWSALLSQPAPVAADHGRDVDTCRRLGALSGPPQASTAAPGRGRPC